MDVRRALVAERRLNVLLRARVTARALRDPVTMACLLSPHYVRRAHLTVIGDAFRDLAAGREDRVRIATPPQVGKSWTAVHWGTFWWLATHPEHRVMIVSYSDSLAVSHGRAVRRLIEEYGARFGLKLDRRNAAVHDYALTSGGGVRAGGVMSSLTGRPCDVLLADDLHKDRSEAESRLIRDRVADQWSSVLMPRLAPGAPALLVGTRWHEDDIQHRVIEQEGDRVDGGRWRSLIMPALCTHPDTDPLGRAMGDPLPHPKIAEDDPDATRRHWEEKRSGMTVRDWGALCQADPRPVEGALLSWDLVRARRHIPQPADAEPAKVAVAVDPSGGGRDTAGIIGGNLATDGRLYYTHDRSGVMPADQWTRGACLLAYEIDADRIIVETNFGGDVIPLAVKTAWSALLAEGAITGMCPRVDSMTVKKGKLLRAEPIAQQWTEDRVRTAATLPDLESQWCSWQPTDPDSPGALDASVILAYALLPVPGAQTMVSTPAGLPGRSAYAGRGPAVVVPRRMVDHGRSRRLAACRLGGAMTRVPRCAALIHRRGTRHVTN